ncbi:MAG TPA: altronate dehydratase family protein [Pyrinomonadaceae bacterium]|jgi:altronate hydrolase|nr:altronate dehydratase family protein [Pyrinomonadaceae bacterium]
MRNVIRIHEADNVAVALAPLAAGEGVSAGDTRVETLEEVPRGHKVALAGIGAGEPVFKYGFPVGLATRDVRAGEWVHGHNLRTALGESVEYRYEPRPAAPRTPAHLAGDGRTFLGYRRPDGRTGTRNEIWIVNTVACVNNSAERIARASHERHSGRGVEGVYTFPHPYGCSQLGDDLKNTQRVLAGLVNHPNAGGVLVLGLGCENNAIRYFAGELGGFDPERVVFLNAQDVEDEVEEGLRLVDELASRAASARRSPRPLSELTLGMKCGGSDGLSGVTANPLVGRVCDALTDRGGTVLLTEVPEMFGAEQLLMERARDEHTFRRVVEMVEDFKDYYRRHGQPVYENPSPGNREGGITTLEEKSLGAIQKGGRAIVTEVIGYGKRATRSGLVLLAAPGNDGVSATAEVVAGANLVLFTTGRGTPLGVPVPTLKISSNTELARRKPKWIDFDAGVLVNDEVSQERAAEELLDMVVRVASGEAEAKNESNGFREIAIFKTGVTL